MSRIPPPLLNKQNLLSYIASNGGDFTKKQLADAFDAKGADRVELKRLLRLIEAEGLIDKTGKGYATETSLPASFIIDIVERDKDGDLFGKAIDKPLIAPILVKTGKDTPSPRIGERFLVRLIQENPPIVKPMKKLDKIESGFLGVIIKSGDDYRVTPINRKQRLDDYPVLEQNLNGAKAGDLVRIELTKTARFATLHARVDEILGDEKSEKSISMIALINHSIPYIFPDNVLKDAEALKPASIKGREDMRHLPFVTIDPHDAKDHDDAVYAEQTSDGFIIYIAIADVAHYVTPYSSLDKEAVKRGNSVYFPDRVVPMLPEAISNELCSLKPYQDKAALVCRAVINENGRRMSHSFHRALIKSHAKLHYAEAEAAFHGDVSDNAKNVLPQIKMLYSAYASLKKARDKRQPLDLNMPERKIQFGDNGEVKSVIIPPRLDAHKLIEEMMILANVCAALTLEDKHVPCVYRIHDAPSHEKLLHLREFLVTLDIKLAKANEMRPANFNHILKRAEGDANEALINQVILQSQAQAEYNIKNIGHFGLNLQSYAHFTSPIRRYSDVLVHRGLIRALGLGDDGLTDAEVRHLKAICEEISNYERRAMAAERETVDRLIATYLADHIDMVFEGRIAGLNNFGLFIKLTETGADGMLPVRNLGDDYYFFDEKNRAFVGKRHGKVYKLGATVHVRLVEAAPMAGALRFEMVEGGEKSTRPLGGNKERSFRKEKQMRPKHIKNSKRRG